VLVPALKNQPLMTVRMGFVEGSLQDWNSNLLPLLDNSASSWQIVYQIDRTPKLLTVDFPRLLCPLIYRENYCSAGSGFVNYRIFHYQWTVFQSQ
jgi:hypothetical protein